MPARLFRQFVSVSVLLCASAVFSAETLSWEQCVERTVYNNLDLSIAKLKLKEAEVALKSQKSVYYPSLTASADRSLNGSKTRGDDNWRNGEGLSAILKGSYTIFNGFGNRASVSKTEAELYAEKANFDQTRSNVEYNLRRIFVQQLYAQDLITLAENIAARRADNVRLVEMRYEGGRENKGSLLLKQAQLTEARYDVEEAKRALTLAQRQLASVMGQTESSGFLLDGALTCSVPPESVSLSELAMQTPTYRSAEADIKSAEQGYIIKRSARFPKISVDSTTGISGEHDVRNESWSAALSVSLPLFKGGQISQDIIQSGLALERTRLTAENTMLTLMNSLQERLNTYRNQYETLRVQEGLLKAAELRAEVARAQYQQGLISFQDWDTIENALISAQKSRLNSRRLADQAEAAWKNALGINSLPGSGDGSQGSGAGRQESGVRSQGPE